VARPRRDGSSELQGGGGERLLGHHPGDQPQRQGLARVEGAAREGELACHGPAEQIVEQTVGHGAEGDLGVGERRALGGDPKVAHQGQVEAARQRRPTYRRDRRQRELQQRAVEAIARGPDAIRHLALADAGELLEVEARREDVATGGDDHDANRLASRELRQSIRDLVAQRDRERVLLPDPVEGQRDHAVHTLGDLHRGAHRVALLPSRSVRYRTGEARARVPRPQRTGRGGSARSKPASRSEAAPWGAGGLGTWPPAPVGEGGDCRNRQPPPVAAQ
jgi:hypothetical protein